MHKQKGSALLIAVFVLALLAAIIIGFSRSTEIDLLIGRNTRILKQAFINSDAGIDLTEELIGISEYERGAKDVTTTYTFNTSGNKLKIEFEDQIFNSTKTTIYITEDNVNASTVHIDYLGSKISDGTSIIFAAGYEGVGKGLGAGGGIARFYGLRSTGHSDQGSMKKTAEIYRSVSSGK